MHGLEKSARNGRPKITRRMGSSRGLAKKARRKRAHQEGRRLVDVLRGARDECGQNQRLRLNARCKVCRKSIAETPSEGDQVRRGRSVGRATAGCGASEGRARGAGARGRPGWRGGPVRPGEGGCLLRIAPCHARMCHRRPPVSPPASSWFQTRKSEWCSVHASDACSQASSTSPGSQHIAQRKNMLRGQSPQSLEQLSDGGAGGTGEACGRKQLRGVSQ